MRRAVRTITVASSIIMFHFIFIQHTDDNGDFAKQADPRLAIFTQGMFINFCIIIGIIFQIYLAPFCSHIENVIGYTTA